MVKIWLKSLPPLRYAIARISGKEAAQAARAAFIYHGMPCTRDC